MNYEFRFDRYRKYQKETIEKIIKAFDEVDCVMYSAPPGAGKSAINMAVASVFSSSFYVLGVKALQDQVKKWFPEAGDIRGRSNYMCPEEPGRTCEDALCTRERKYKCRSVCPYKEAKMNAEASKVCLTNIWYYYLEGGRFFEDRELLIIDEAHNLPEQLVDFGRVTISPRTVFGLWYDLKDSKDVDYMIERIGTEILFYESKEWLSDEDARKVRIMKNVLFRLKNVVRDEFVEGRYKNARVFVPLYSKYPARKVFDRAEKVLMCSATLNQDLMVRELGLREYFGRGNTMYFSVPSIFDPRRRPLFLVPVCEFTKEKQTEENVVKMREMIRLILEKHKDERGIIFVPGYRYMEMLDGISDRLVFHGREDRGEVLDEWINNGGGNKVLVGVKMEEGLDLKDDLARFSIIMKAPYPDVTDIRVKERLRRKHWNWYFLLTQQVLCQAYGRIVRSEDDYGTVYVLDKGAVKMLKRKGVPKWIREAMIEEKQKRLEEFV